MIQDEHIPSYQSKLIHYLFLCLAFELRKDGENIIYQKPVWSDPETTFNMVMYHCGIRLFDYCTECIKSLGGHPERECRTVITVHSKSSKARDVLKNRFIVLLNDADGKLAELNGVTPQEFYALKTNPVILDISSTDSKHIVTLNADIKDTVDSLAWDQALQPWRDCDRIRDYFEINVSSDDEPSEIRMVFYRQRKQKKFVKYLYELGLEY